MNSYSIGPFVPSDTRRRYQKTSFKFLAKSEIVIGCYRRLENAGKRRFENAWDLPGAAGLIWMHFEAGGKIAGVGFRNPTDPGDQVP